MAALAQLPLLVTALSIASLPINARAAYVGVQALGFANFKPADVNILADEFVAAGGELELSALPFTFNPNSPFGNLDAFVKNVLPRFRPGSSLRVTVHLWFENSDGKFDFNNFGNRSALLARAKAFDTWVKNVRSWASQRGFGSRLSIHLVPILEDDAPNSDRYSRLLNFISEQQRADGVSTAFRRSPDGPSASFRVGAIPHEFHGRFKEIQNFFRPFDRFSNDGCFVWLDGASVPGSTESSQSFPSFCSSPPSFSEFLLDQQFALRQQIGFLFWRPAYNGLTQYAKTVPPNRRFNLAPFTGAKGNFERAALRRVLNTR
jgi:hypothetical protein